MRLTDWITQKVETTMATYTVLLDDDTTGTVVSSLSEDALIGQHMTVSLHDENGTPIERVGKVVEVLESDS